MGSGTASGFGSAERWGRVRVRVVRKGDVPRGADAYGRGMGKTILTIIGVVLAVWLAMTVVGAIISMLKFFFFIGLVAVIVVLAVTAVSKMSKSH